MQSPLGYKHPPHKIYRLRPALYAFTQAPRAWLAKFSIVVAKQGFIPSSSDFSLFIRTTNAGTILILLNIDDMIITSDNISCI